MKLLIVGPENRTNTEISLLERAKEYFDTVLYVPMAGVRIETTTDESIPYYKNTNLFEFDAVLGRISKKNSDAGYVLMKLFEDRKLYTINSYKSILYSYNEFLAPIFLKTKGIPTPKIHFAITRKAIEHILPDIKYPVLLRLPYEKKGSVVIDSYDSAKGVIDTIEKLSQPIMIQDIYRNGSPVTVLVAGSRLFCIEGKDTVYTPTEQEKYLLKKAASLFEAGLCSISAIKHNNHILITGMDICPSMDKYTELFEKDIYDIFLKQIAKNTERISSKNPIARLANIFENALSRK
ncbi:MAG: hypothetical protein KAT91_01060 [Candidatus Aenigmarchaeota archaeon]|nr:hypothetical protein [Candidatus Aenigmarchaeota archaeon]